METDLSDVSQACRLKKAAPVPYFTTLRIALHDNGFLEVPRISAWQFKDTRDTGHQGEMVRGGQADRTVRRARILALAKVTCGNEVLKL